MAVKPINKSDAKIMELADTELKNSNMSTIFSYRYAFLLGWKAKEKEIKRR